jgi:hypothetical protein
MMTSKMEAFGGPAVDNLLGGLMPIALVPGGIALLLFVMTRLESSLPAARSVRRTLRSRSLAMPTIDATDAPAPPQQAGGES